MELAIEQIRAARGLLHWNQQTLAKECGISVNTLRNIESGLSQPRPKTLGLIRTALESNGIAFLPSLGVKLSQGEVKTQLFEGKNAIFSLWMDIYDRLEAGQERLINGVVEHAFLRYEPRFESMMQRYVEKGISGRILALHGDHNFVDPSSQYRWLKRAQFSTVPYYLYGENYAVLLWEPVIRVLIIRNAAIAASFRHQFEHAWELSVVPPAYMRRSRGAS